MALGEPEVHWSLRGPYSWEVSIAVRSDLRNVAIIAHVDHGKTTLVDSMLWQSGAFRENADVNERVMDSMDLEREKGITILAKQTAVDYYTESGERVTINIIDTPGHADFGGEVERGLEMVNGVLLLVDAAEGPLPQTRFVLAKALAKGLPVVVVINKVDRQDARITKVLEEVYELFFELATREDQVDFPVVYASARAGRASLDEPEDGTMPDSEDLRPLFDTLLNVIPAPEYDADAPLRAQVTNLDASPYLGRLAICRVHSGEIRKGQQVAWCRDDQVQSVKVSELLMTQALERRSVESAFAGDIIAVAGLPDITIGDTLSDVADPQPLPAIRIDEPNLSVTLGVNTSPLAGKSGSKLTARLVKQRLDTELVGNVSLRVLPTERPDTWEVLGRGELQLAVLVEMMRREGFELTVGKPEVVTRVNDGVTEEPVERLTIDIPEDFVGVVTQLMGVRKGKLQQMTNHSSAWVRLEYLVPARGLIGFRTEFLTETRGTGLMHHVFEDFEAWAGAMQTRVRGSLVADRSGKVTTYACFNLQERGALFVTPGDEVYEGMIIGENARPDDMDVNATKERKLTNVRSSTGEELERLVPANKPSLEHALEFCRADECVEVTPDAIRLRKTELNATTRARSTARQKNRG